MSSSPTRLGDPILLSFNAPKKIDHGEDADPVALTVQNEVWLAVFDGMGGAGAATYQTEAGRLTGAYIAARLAATSFESWARDVAAETPAGLRASSLADHFRTTFTAEMSTLGNQTSKIRSKLLRPLPTTAAAIGIKRVQDGWYECNLLWAGDSRLFFLSAEYGLVQLSTDHLNDSVDAQQNLIEDAVLSNQLSGDGKFYIEEGHVRIGVPFLAIAATDGCFGYVLSPVIFENIILQALLGSESVDGFRTKLMESIAGVTADDASMAVAQFGWNTYDDLKQSFRERAKSVSSVTDDLHSHHSQIHSAREKLREAERAYDEKLKSIWEAYRIRYEGIVLHTKSGPQ
ncbi:hypothetical protein IU429_02870 [Nocardia elegans]|uniref:PPM-type phosphatase domain-containing protein n=1 Tax=Nocardia elegans TaxID=300029 RepID=A0ABW6TRM9_9NOCA|nr:hypothetical protein [Nocardia elegans]MBF6446602.1 hypothetical protein [Nocardia elegans]